MTRATLLGRCSAAAAAVTMLAGLAAAPAMARPDPGEPASQQIQLDDGPTRAQIEHDEQLSVPSSDHDDVAAAPDEFPWAAASLAAAGIAAAATGGMVVLRHRRTVLLGE
jgi:hypothetical protein